ncbi:hypothetical protein G4B88_024470 [Cannabis sativa]|uniref:RING-type E3 ubiquitin transferase n=1 Tax=Cannabis sativa TaxID=3483 RepID=A0A7J6H5F0_CANSA|nr:hypothetical protein G4B88_024929 [Cannabis sativa]KAF4390464.1 hypothetical protein G4B88_024470 [Cannabis sativa]
MAPSRIRHYYNISPYDNCEEITDNISIGYEASNLICSHIYHKECIVDWLRISKFCPLCRFEII